MSDSSSGFDAPAGVNDFASQAASTTKWYKRWYVFVLPLAVLIGAVFLAYNG